MDYFDEALGLTLHEEGGRVDDPRDAGGRTNKGITQAVYDTWRKAHGLARRDVFTITAAEVTAIYRNDYANHIRFDDMPHGVGFVVFDDAVNAGAVEAVKELQAVLGFTGAAVDGLIGAVTLARLKGINDRRGLVNRLCDRRLTFYRRLKAFVTFGRGWTARVEFVRSHALAMVG